MNSPDSQQIIYRFHEALRLLKAMKKIRGAGTFTERYGINRRNFDTAIHRPDKGMFQMAWLGYLVRDYSVSATWLLTGLGYPFGSPVSVQPVHIFKWELEEGFE
jgi:hypothetical protein